jgi:hypothetical protein
VNAIHALSQLSYAPAGFSHLRTALPQHGNVVCGSPSVNEECIPLMYRNLIVSSTIRTS